MQLRKFDAFVLPKWSLLLIIPPVLLYFGGDFLYAFSSFKAVIPAPLPSIRNWPQHEMAGRTVVLTTVIGVVSIAFLAVGLFAVDVARLFGPTARKILLVGVASLVALLILSFALTFSQVTRSMPRMEDYVGRCFYPTALIAPSALATGELDFRSSEAVRHRKLSMLRDQWVIDRPGKPALCSKPVTPHADKPGLSRRLRDWVKTIQIAMLIGVPALMLGTISCIARPAPSLPAATRKALRQLQHQRLQRYLYGAALLLTAGMLFMIAWLRWPLFVFATPNETTPYVALINAITLYFGVNYSLVIASYYLPVAMLLRRREATMTPDTAPSAEVTKGAATPIRTLGLDMAMKLFTILAPAIASGLPALFDLAFRAVNA